jgi:hypothetical protein
VDFIILSLKRALLFRCLLIFSSSFSFILCRGERRTFCVCAKCVPFSLFFVPFCLLHNYSITVSLHGLPLLATSFKLPWNQLLMKNHFFLLSCHSGGLAKKNLFFHTQKIKLLDFHRYSLSTSSCFHFFFLLSASSLGFWCGETHSISKRKLVEGGEHLTNHKQWHDINSIAPGLRARIYCRNTLNWTWLAWLSRENQ